MAVETDELTYFNCIIKNETDEPIQAEYKSDNPLPILKKGYRNSTHIAIARLQVPSTGVPLSRHNIPYKKWAFALGYNGGVPIDGFVPQFGERTQVFQNFVGQSSAIEVGAVSGAAFTGNTGGVSITGTVLDVQMDDNYAYVLSVNAGTYALTAYTINLVETAASLTLLKIITSSGSGTVIDSFAINPSSHDVYVGKVAAGVKSITKFTYGASPFWTVSGLYSTTWTYNWSPTYANYEMVYVNGSSAEYVYFSDPTDSTSVVKFNATSDSATSYTMGVNQLINSVAPVNGGNGAIAIAYTDMGDYAHDALVLFNLPAGASSTQAIDASVLPVIQGLAEDKQCLNVQGRAMLFTPTSAPVIVGQTTMKVLKFTNPSGLVCSNIMPSMYQIMPDVANNLIYLIDNSNYNYSTVCLLEYSNPASTSMNVRVSPIAKVNILRNVESISGNVLQSDALGGFAAPVICFNSTGGVQGLQRVLMYQDELAHRAISFTSNTSNGYGYSLKTVNNRVSSMPTTNLFSNTTFELVDQANNTANINNILSLASSRVGNGNSIKSMATYTDQVINGGRMSYFKNEPVGWNYGVMPRFPGGIINNRYAFFTYVSGTASAGDVGFGLVDLWQDPSLETNLFYSTISPANSQVTFVCYNKIDGRFIFGFMPMTVSSPYSSSNNGVFVEFSMSSPTSPPAGTPPSPTFHRVMSGLHYGVTRAFTLNFPDEYTSGEYTTWVALSMNRPDDGTNPTPTLLFLLKSDQSIISTDTTHSTLLDIDQVAITSTASTGYGKRLFFVGTSKADISTFQIDYTTGESSILPVVTTTQTIVNPTIWPNTAFVTTAFPGYPDAVFKGYFRSEIITHGSGQMSTLYVYWGVDLTGSSGVVTGVLSCLSLTTGAFTAADLLTNPVHLWTQIQSNSNNLTTGMQALQEDASFAMSEYQPFASIPVSSISLNGSSFPSTSFGISLDVDYTNPSLCALTYSTDLSLSDTRVATGSMTITPTGACTLTYPSPLASGTTAVFKNALYASINDPVGVRDQTLAVVVDSGTAFVTQNTYSLSAASSNRVSRIFNGIPTLASFYALSADDPNIVSNFNTETNAITTAVNFTGTGLPPITAYLDGPLVPVNVGDYDIWSVQEYLGKINLCLETIYNQLAEDHTTNPDFPAGQKPPYMTYNASTMLFTMHYDETMNNSKFTFYYNDDLFYIFRFPIVSSATVPLTIDGVPNVPMYQLYTQDPKTYSTTAGHYYDILQEGSSMQKLNHFQRILIRSITIPVNHDNETNNRSVEAITDVMADTGNFHINGTLNYSPMFYRWYTMQQVTALFKITLQLWYEDLLGNRYPLMLVPGDTASFKIVFDKLL